MSGKGIHNNGRKPEDYNNVFQILQNNCVPVTQNNCVPVTQSYLARTGVGPWVLPDRLYPKTYVAPRKI